MNMSLEQGLPPPALQRGDSFNLSDTGTFNSSDFKVSRDGIGGLASSDSDRLLKGVKILLDDLEMTDELGQGASGIVRKAIHKPTGLVVAVKTINISDKGKRSQMVNELRSLTQSSQCPFLVGLHDAFYEEMQVGRRRCAKKRISARALAGGGKKGSLGLGCPGGHFGGIGAGLAGVGRPGSGQAAFSTRAGSEDAAFGAWPLSRGFRLRCWLLLRSPAAVCTSARPRLPMPLLRPPPSSCTAEGAQRQPLSRAGRARGATGWAAAAARPQAMAPPPAPSSAVRWGTIIGCG